MGSYFSTLMSMVPVVASGVEMVMAASKPEQIATIDPKAVCDFLKDISRSSNNFTLAKYHAKDASFDRVQDILEVMAEDIFICTAYKVLKKGCEKQNLAAMEQIEVVKGEGFLVVKAERNGDKVSFILISYKGDVVLTDAQVLALLVQNGCLAKTSNDKLVYVVDS